MDGGRMEPLQTPPVHREGLFAEGPGPNICRAVKALEPLKAPGGPWRAACVGPVMIMFTCKSQVKGRP